MNFPPSLSVASILIKVEVLESLSSKTISTISALRANFLNDSEALIAPFSVE